MAEKIQTLTELLEALRPAPSDWVVISPQGSVESMVKIMLPYHKLLKPISTVELVRNPDVGEAERQPVMQYYCHHHNCTAEGNSDTDCICWIDEGKGPYKDEKHDIPNNLTWRVKP